MALRKYTYSDLIVDYLAQMDAEYVFGVPGGAIEPLFDALARERDRITPRQYPQYRQDGRRETREATSPRLIISRHETGAAYMADGYARATGRLGVCCATTGPGATNLITGVASAFADRTPMLVITPQTALPNFGKLGLQESSSDAIDVVSMFDKCTRYNTMISHPDQFEGKLFNALIHAYQRPKGPVHLSIPMDILKQPHPKRRASFQVGPLIRKSSMLDKQSLKALHKLLKNAKNIVLFVGGGCCEAVDEITRFAKITNAPIITTPKGKRWIRSDNPLYRGVFGFAGHRTARETLLDKNVDLVLAAGTSLGELSTGGWDKNALLNEKLVHIEATLENFSRSPMACLHVHGTLSEVFKQLSHKLKREHRNNKTGIQLLRNKDASQTKTDNNVTLDLPHFKVDEPEKYFSDNIPIKPQRLIRELETRLPQNTCFYVDAGNAWAWAIHYLKPNDINRFHIAMGFGAMGWAIGASIGGAFSANRDTIVCLTGDGSYLMSGQEITVAIQHQLPVIFVILNDNSLGMVKHGQRMGGGEQIGFELPVIDYAAMARTMGANGITIKKPDDFGNIDFKKLCKDKGPTLLDVYIDGEEVPPMGVRMKTLDRDVSKIRKEERREKLEVVNASNWK
ncbi:MAG TPA: thiamine pyrophosphate-binding protein [Gammaproteobacteria bacterium]|nr:thiamine pyrophosphate-binding protein [Gammaproteobacteria bacterium]